MEYGEINRPGEDVVLDYAFSGSVICKTLEIRKDGGLFGVVEADSVKVAGTFEGAADCGEFVAVPGAKGRGAVFAGRILAKDCDVAYFHSTSRPSSLRDRAGIDHSVEQAIDRGIAEAISKRLPAAAMTPSDPPAPPAPAQQDEAPSFGLSARLAALGVEAAFPEDTTPAAEADDKPSPAAARPATSEEEFPQLV